MISELVSESNNYTQMVKVSYLTTEALLKMNDMLYVRSRLQAAWFHWQAPLNTQVNWIKITSTLISLNLNLLVSNAGRNQRNQGRTTPKRWFSTKSLSIDAMKEH